METPLGSIESFAAVSMFESRARREQGDGAPPGVAEELMKELHAHRNLREGMIAKDFHGLWNRVLSPLGIASVKSQHENRHRRLNAMRREKVAGSSVKVQERAAFGR